MAVPVSEQRKLFQRSGDMCAFSGCKKALTAKQTDSEPVASLGEVAHIVGDSAIGPRGASPLTHRERNRYENLILLCNYHHQLIDSHPVTWTVSRLEAMKRAHEEWVRARLGDQDPYTAGMSRHGAPVRTRHRIPSISCRLLHNDGRPGRDGAGNNSSSAAHCSSVRSNRLVTARVSTRSPVFRFFLVDEPPTGDLTHSR